MAAWVVKHNENDESKILACFDCHSIAVLAAIKRITFIYCNTGLLCILASGFMFCVFVCSIQITQHVSWV